MTASIAVVVLVLVLVAGAVPARDMASPAGPAPAPAAATPAASKPSAVERYEAIRKRGAPIGVLERRVALRAGPGRDSPVLARLRRKTEFDSPTVLAVTGRSGRWLRVISTELPNGRRGWIPLGSVRLGANPWRVTADVSSRTVSVYRRGRLKRRFSVAVGGSATPTPTGRFAVTDKIRMNDHAAYGCCALALTGHQTRMARGWSGGDRLAIHGTQLTGTIGSAASLGCLRARDADARYLISRVWLGTVVTIRD
jgi:lipoprotein-anchoring transpeptidase ErfK/SrfK